MSTNTDIMIEIPEADLPSPTIIDLDESEEFRTAKDARNGAQKESFANTDTDGDQEIEDPRLYYYSAYNDLESLIKVRREWDMYIVSPGTLGASLIPSYFIRPPTPSSAWAVYLVPTEK